ncbi:putative lipase/esterase [Marinithermofilum abyssi]|uniref:Putative lipase/esterase n=1 Tax=Marinithermofilum abyssi TaxID=1571185 RepID=A0A8J2YBQ5_9BACL|nr:alpha/beta hydrolase [Marinithermofilum abyssi]GGE06448.1 putative lipase/esterase [Marinithermofilum abyssi]
MVLDHRIRSLLQEIARRVAPKIIRLPLKQARRAFHIASKQLPEVRLPLRRIENRTLSGPGGSLPVRIYHPFGTPPFPALLYLHGGGWVFGGVDTSDAICRFLSHYGQCVVVSVDYRRAPEHPFPAALEDAYFTLGWVSQNEELLEIDSTRLGVAGDSAGGNLAAGVTLLARERGGPSLTCQALFYPVTRYGFDTESYRRFGTGYYLTKEEMQWFWNHYLPNPGDPVPSLASPLDAERLHDLPPAILITAEYDPLRDEGEAYARRLKAEGVPVQWKRYPGMVHSFLNMSGLVEQSRQALEEIGQQLHQMLRKAPTSENTDTSIS